MRTLVPSHMLAWSVVTPSLKGMQQTSIVVSLIIAYGRSEWTSLEPVKG